MKARLARWLRRRADRLDDDGAPKRTPFSFTYEYGRGGTKLRSDGRGCPLYYVSAGDFRRAHAESDTENTVADWLAASRHRRGYGSLPPYRNQGGRP